MKEEEEGWNNDRKEERGEQIWKKWFPVKCHWVSCTYP